VRLHDGFRSGARRLLAGPCRCAGVGIDRALGRADAEFPITPLRCWHLIDFVRCELPHTSQLTPELFYRRWRMLRPREKVDHRRHSKNGEPYV